MVFSRFALSLAALALIPSVSAPAQAPRDPILPVPLRPVVEEFYRTCDQATASGLRYSVLHKGKGRLPQLDDVVVLDYIVYSAHSGEIFDEAVGAPMPVGGLISGATEGLLLVPQGSVVRLCIPAVLAYGPTGVGPIPADTDLVFQAELREVATRSEYEKHTLKAPRPRN